MEIIASIGPATETEEVMKSLGEAGTTIFRLNCSHQDHDVQREFIKRKNAAVPEMKILIDIQGIKVRLGSYERYEVDKGQEFVMDSSAPDNPPKFFKKGDLVKYAGDPISVSPLLLDWASVGDALYIGDGEVMMEVKKKDGTKLVCEVTDAGVIGIHKAVTVQGKKMDSGAFTDKDIEDLRFVAEVKPEYIALSFVQSAADVKKAREVLAEVDADYKPVIISKIETVMGVDNLEEIIKESDGVMVARGDLALHIDFAEMGLVQKRILDLAKKHKKFSVVATGMIESLMDGNKVPSRAEVVDLTVAKMWGASGVMVSSETTVGEQPVYSIEVMKRILDAV